MLVKIYLSICVVFAVSGGMLLLGGVFTMFVAVVFGFIAFGLIFAGMMCVLPGEVAHPALRQIKLRSPVFVMTETPVETTKSAHKILYNEWRSDRSKKKVTLLGKIGVEPKVTV